MYLPLRGFRQALETLDQLGAVEAMKVREQLEDMLEKKYQVQKSTAGATPLVRSDMPRALAAGFYTQVACRDENGRYVRVQDNDVRIPHFAVQMNETF